MNKINQNTKLLKAKVLDKIGRPVSSRVVLATIESFGIRGQDVTLDYGFANLDNLAEYIYGKLAKESVANTEKSFTTTFSVSNYLKTKIELFSRYYSLGIFHLLPIFIQILAIIWFGYSLWTSIDFNELQSTAVVIGVIIGMILSGGFVQVLGNQLSFYYNYKDYSNSLAFIKYVLYMFLKFIIIINLLLLTINYFVPLMPYSVLIISLCYSTCISVVLVFLAIMHPLKQRWVISLAVLIGTLFSIISIYYNSLHIYWSHWIGMLLVVLCVGAYLKYYFKKYSSKVKINPSFKKTNVIYKNASHFIYGTLFYLFFFTDRILAWSVPRVGNKTLLFTYEKDYEIGMDIAILVFLLLAGVLEYSIASFSKFVQIEQKNTLVININGFFTKMWKVYKQNIAILLLSSLFIFGIVYWIITSSWGYQYQFNEILNQLSIRVCLIASMAYYLLAWSVLNTLYLFSLKQSKIVINGLVLSLIINVIIGFVCSRLISYEYSVLGLLAGSACYFVISTISVYKFYKKLDYYYYAAY